MQTNHHHGEKPMGIDEVLSLAIAKEDEACRRYTRLAERMVDAELSQLLRAMALQETSHRQQLEAVAAGDLSAIGLAGFTAEPVAEINAVVEPGPDASLAQVLLYAVNAEQKAFQLYSALAEAAADPGIVTLLRTLAEEEDRHRNDVDRLYRDIALR